MTTAFEVGMLVELTAPIPFLDEEWRGVIGRVVAVGNEEAYKNNPHRPALTVDIEGLTEEGPVWVWADGVRPVLRWADAVRPGGIQANQGDTASPNQGDTAPRTPVAYTLNDLEERRAELVALWHATPHDCEVTGWDVFDTNHHGWEIERDDEFCLFERDDDAVTHVVLRAVAGDRDAVLALAIHTLSREIEAWQNLNSFDPPA